MVLKLVQFWAQPAVNDGSIFALFSKLIQNGRKVIQKNVQNRIAKKRQTGHSENQTVAPTQTSRYFNVQPKRVTWFSKLAATRTTGVSFAGNVGRYMAPNAGRLSLYAFVGVGFASKSGLLDCDNRGDVICDQIKELFKPVSAEGWKNDCCVSGLDDIDIGSMIAKGSNAAVYEARLRTECDQMNDMKCDMNPDKDVIGLNCIQEIFMDIDADTSDGEDTSSNADTVTGTIEGSDTSSDSNDDSFVILDDEESCHSDSTLSSINDDSPLEMTPDMTPEFDLAIKMVWNMHVPSNPALIMRVMENEALPAKMSSAFEDLEMWENGNRVKKKRLPPHPSIVDMQSVFVADVPELDGAMVEFPAVLPQHLNPYGCGRNKTMFSVMKRYPYTLREYLASKELDSQSAMLILCQLVEGLVHLGQHGVAHRDIKTDNILVETEPGGLKNRVVLSDFGCASMDQLNGLLIPYNTDNIAKEGNPALMAPEIANAVPGRDSWLDYRKSDLWALGTLVYELLGERNPFYCQGVSAGLDSRRYTEDDLPQLPENTPRIFRKLVQLMLIKDPSKRLSPQVLGNILHILLWGPPHWDWSTKPECLPNDFDIIGWLMILSAEVICKRIGQRSSKLGSCESQESTTIDVEYEQKHLFLSRLCFRELKQSFNVLAMLGDN
ncbi:unnamed protein product [Owenia fusiformis]|uniref:non-specific serine/threonine protein kinase n=1 Tax=Owenia fusiformis TaxID=6347 RepID=A0A8S4MZZ6_OWEFU|nr:unnamed protein product [Owenia fusiformis]